jgi:hypothetical protein
MLILFQLPGSHILALNSYGKFHRHYKYPEDLGAKEDENQNHGKADGCAFPDDASPSGFKAGGDHDSVAQ